MLIIKNNGQEDNSEVSLHQQITEYIIKPVKLPLENRFLIAVCTCHSSDQKYCQQIPFTSFALAASLTSTSTTTSTTTTNTTHCCYSCCIIIIVVVYNYHCYCGSCIIIIIVWEREGFEQIYIIKMMVRMVIINKYKYNTSHGVVVVVVVVISSYLIFLQLFLLSLLSLF